MKTPVRGPRTRTTSARLWRNSQTFTSSLKSKRLVCVSWSPVTWSRYLRHVDCAWCVQVLLELTRQEDGEKTVLSLSVCQLGAEGKRRSFDLSVASYLRRVTLDYCDVPGDVYLTDDIIPNVCVS